MYMYLSTHCFIAVSWGAFSSGNSTKQSPYYPLFFKFLAAADWGEKEHIEATKKFCLITIRVLFLSSQGMIPP